MNLLWIWSTNMRRYYFHIRRGTEILEDYEEMELPSDAAVLEEAKAAAREILASHISSGDLIDDEAFVIVDESGETVLSLPFRSAMPLE
jgi:hypothetical protein